MVVVKLDKALGAILLAVGLGIFLAPDSLQLLAIVSIAAGIVGLLSQEH